MLGSLAAGFSRNINELIVFRGVAGAGGGGIISMAQIIISDVVSLRERGKYQGLIGGIVAMGYAVGPLIGGALSEKVSWRVRIVHRSSSSPITHVVPSGVSGSLFQSRFLQF